MTHELAGARGAIEDPEDVLRRAAEWAKARRADVMVADARAVFGRDHLESAVLHAERAKERGTMSTRSLSMETLLYLSGRRQIGDAIATAGIRRGTAAIALVVFGEVHAAEAVEALGWSLDAKVLEAASKDPAVLGLSPAELTTIPDERWSDLALERVALLDIEK